MGVFFLPLFFWFGGSGGILADENTNYTEKTSFSKCVLKIFTK
jgi:hypothetical protein